MKSEHKPLILIAIALVAMMAISSFRGLGNRELQVLPPGGAKRPELSKLAGWIEGRSLNSADLDGKVVVIDCFASWCGPCAAATPELIHDYRRFHGQGVEFIGLTSETADDVAAVREFVGRHKIEWPVAYGAEFQLQSLGVEAIPMLFVYDAQGDAIWNSDLPGNLEKAIRAAIQRSRDGAE